MRKDLHPENYRPMTFKDMSNDEIFITKSTVNAKEIIEIDDEAYPLARIEISNASHSFCTGKVKLVDIIECVSKLMSRYGNRGKKADK